MPRPTGTPTAIATPTATATAAPTPTSLNFTRADSGSITETGKSTGIFGIVLADAIAAFNPTSRRMSVVTTIPNFGVNEVPSATARLWNEFTVGGTPGQSVTAQFNVGVSWKGTLAGNGALGTGSSIDIRTVVLDRSDGDRQIASCVLHSAERRESALSGDGVGDSGSELVDFTALLIRGHRYRLQVTATCESTSGLLGAQAACGFGPISFLLVTENGYVD